MPIEIKELVIRAVAVKSEPKDGKGLSRAAKAAQAFAPTDERDAVVQECVKEVMRILRQAEER
jgi:hypothetical protein